MIIKTVPIKKLKVAEYNPRLDLQPGDPDYEKLKKSIKAFDLVEPLIWNKKSGNLVGGHQRLKILKERGDTEVEVSVVDLTDAKEKALNLALNKIGGDWDPTKLKDLLGELDTGEFDLEIAGFDEHELERLLVPYSFRPGEAAPKLSDEEKNKLGIDDAPEGFFDTVETFAVFFSGGKDSLAATAVLKEQFPDKRIIAIFSDPGVEFPGISAEAEKMTTVLGVEFEVVKSDLDWWCWIQEKGWPSIMFRPCQQKFIFDPINKQVKKLDKASTIIIGGQRKTQANRGAVKERYGESPSLKGYKTYSPVFYADDDLVFQLIEPLPQWTGYDRGFVRTACWCCPGQCRAQAQALQKHYPGLADTIREWEKRLGQSFQWTSTRDGKLPRGTTFDHMLGSDLDDPDTGLGE